VHIRSETLMTPRLFLAGFVLFLFGCGGSPTDERDQPTGGMSAMGGSLPMGTARLDLSFDHVLDDEALMLGSVIETASGPQVRVDMLRYWVSNLVLETTDGEIYRVPSAYYLVEMTDANTRTTLVLDGIPDGTYRTLHMGIGVDADHNYSLDLFEGELSTTVDMHWDWTTGFVFLKLEGRYGPGANEAPFIVHVGNDPMYQAVTLALDGLAVGTAEPATVRLGVNLAPLFDVFDVSENSNLIGGQIGSSAETVISRFAAGISVLSE